MTGGQPVVMVLHWHTKPTMKKTAVFCPRGVGTRRHCWIICSIWIHQRKWAHVLCSGSKSFGPRPGSPGGGLLGRGAALLLFTYFSSCRWKVPAPLFQLVQTCRRTGRPHHRAQTPKQRLGLCNLSARRRVNPLAPDRETSAHVKNKLRVCSADVVHLGLREKFWRHDAADKHDVSRWIHGKRHTRPAPKQFDILIFFF